MSESITMGLVAGTACELHANLVAEHEGRSILNLWKVIKAQHITNNSSL